MATQEEVDQARLDAEMSLLTKVKDMVDGKSAPHAIEAVTRAYRAVAGGEQPAATPDSK